MTRFPLVGLLTAMFLVILGLPAWAQRGGGGHGGMGGRGFHAGVRQGAGDARGAFSRRHGMPAQRGGSWGGGGGRGPWSGGGGRRHDGGHGEWYGGHDHHGWHGHGSSVFIGVNPWWGAYPYGYGYYGYPSYYDVYPGDSYVTSPGDTGGQEYIEQPRTTPEGADGYWYYCESKRGYYPRIAECPEDWIQVPPTAE